MEIENILNKINITNQNSFYKAMNILKYHAVKELPFKIYDYVSKHQPDLSKFKDFFYDELIILKNNTKRKITEMNESAFKGYLNLIKYLHGKGQTWDIYTYINAIIGGNLEILKYLSQYGLLVIDTDDKYYSIEISRYITKDGLLVIKNEYDVLENYYENYYYNDENYSKPRCLDYEDEDLNGEDFCFYAAAYGHIEILKFLHENKSYISGWVFGGAAKYGNLECLIYLTEIGYKIDTYFDFGFDYASRYGKLECLRYLHEKGYPWSSETCKSAAAYNNLKCLKYAIENGCPYDEQAFECAIRNENLECLKYLHSVKCKFPSNIYEIAARSRKLKSFKFLYQNGYPWSKKTCFWAIAGSSYNRKGDEVEDGIYLKILKYAIENGCPYDKDNCILNAKERADKNILKYLQNLR